ncbi:lysophospholipid acyltransferase family protein [Caproiciproducens faecalis]|uniref:1-acyl-sn-glycerol-3-phosphate acyltransferase n=1 Tax=Caproiciproducens faecalis TaxID=2820301 RepID=A0ABS7DQ62_9FIRM|nr:lysophospholipid acyltransferase family protein [Caproiciproducens faecalis]MBW7573454.1 1-acyl-sn-glycerol-3-phosphate acyltransferase [Caproiciproducens faecalis]
MSLYFFCLRLAAPFARMIYRVRYKGVDNIPESGKLILCSNHKSVIDPLFLAAPFRRQIRYMGKSELFDNHGKLVRWWLYRMGAFPVVRDSADAQSLKTAVHILQDGGILGIFPQGKCVFDNSPFRPKAGAAMLAYKAQAPVLPVAIYCDGVIKPFCQVTVRFGELIPFEELDMPDHSSASLRAAAGKIADKINEMLEEKH